MRFFIGIGSNLGLREENIAKALSILSSSCSILRSSSLYETEPVGCPGGLFLNTVAEVETNLPVEEFHARLKYVEQALGRTGKQNEAREMDIDILLSGTSIISTKQLTIPHPRMHLRNFVLMPMVEIAPDSVHPLLKKTMRELFLTSPDTHHVRKI